MREMGFSEQGMGSAGGPDCLCHRVVEIVILSKW